MTTSWIGHLDTSPSNVLQVDMPYNSDTSLILITIPRYHFMQSSWICIQSRSPTILAVVDRYSGGFCGNVWTLFSDMWSKMASPLVATVLENQAKLMYWKFSLSRKRNDVTTPFNLFLFKIYRHHLYIPRATWHSGGRLNKKDGLTRYGNSHVKDKTS